jgi:hypothetical protein
LLLPQAVLLEENIEVPLAFHILYFQEKALDLVRFRSFDALAEHLSDTGYFAQSSVADGFDVSAKGKVKDRCFDADYLFRVIG